MKEQKPMGITEAVAALRSNKTVYCHTGEKIEPMKNENSLYVRRTADDGEVAQGPISQFSKLYAKQQFTNNKPTQSPKTVDA